MWYSTDSSVHSLCTNEPQPSGKEKVIKYRLPSSVLAKRDPLRNTRPQSFVLKGVDPFPLELPTHLSMTSVHEEWGMSLVLLNETNQMIPKLNPDFEFEVRCFAPKFYYPLFFQFFYKSKQNRPTKSLAHMAECNSYSCSSQRAEQEYGQHARF